MSKVQRQAKTQTEGLGIKMKRILILFIGLILGCNLTNAKSVSCWEEYTTYNTAHNSSFMATTLGSDVTIVSTGIEYNGIAQMYERVSADFYVGAVTDYRVTTPPYIRNGGYYYLGSPYNTTDNYSFTNSTTLYSAGKIYHYCIVDEGSSGGGGGSATGSVNFIIKATS